MCRTFLRSIFEDIYEDIYYGTHNKSCTVMYAYDDALQGHLGRMADDRRLTSDRVGNRRLMKLAQESRDIHIISNGRTELMEHVKAELQAYNQALTVTADGPDIPENAAVAELCESIFTQMDTTLAKIYIDEDENVLLTEDDVLMVINHDYSFETFYESQQALFMMYASEIRAKEKH